ncbi:MAG: hypothetical protein R3240_08970 [Gammaproteobacteria bacterium]|nr:hypothetical protein [Gammaproteobacteria bacterium]
MTSKSCVNTALSYNIQTEDGASHDYHFSCDNRLLSFKQDEKPDNIPWARLGHKQCPNCPLDANEVENCPLAISLSGLLRDWNNVISYTQVKLIVKNEQRTVIADTTAQKALGSLIGLIIATSDCPHTQFFRPMAQFHLPLANSEETSFRAISTYLLMLYFRKQDGQDVEFNLDGLSRIYKDVHEVNIHIKKRLLDAVSLDAALNAVAILDIFTLTSTDFLEDELKKLKQLFPNL